MECSQKIDKYTNHNAQILQVNTFCSAPKYTNSIHAKIELKFYLTWAHMDKMELFDHLFNSIILLAIAQTLFVYLQHEEFLLCTNAQHSKDDDMHFHSCNEKRFLHLYAYKCRLRHEFFIPHSSISQRLHGMNCCCQWVIRYWSHWLALIVKVFDMPDLSS